jgi:hypothetical protein
MEKKNSAPANRVPNLFIEKHHKDVMGILHSFDRLRLQGSLRYLYCAEIFEEYLSKAKVLCKDFKRFATGLTNEVCQGAERLAQSLKRVHLFEQQRAVQGRPGAQDR